MTKRPMHHRVVTRRGVAPIEYLMFLPIFVVFMLAMLWITRVQLTHAATGRAVEREGAQQAGKMEDDGVLSDGADWRKPLAPELDQLLEGFYPRVSSVSGAVASRSERDTGEGVKTVIEPLGSVADRTQYITHSWEDLVFKFPESSGAQPQLTLPPQIRGIAPSLSNLSAFVRLGQFGGQGSLSSLNSLAALTNRESSVLPAINASLNEMQRQQRELEQQIQEYLAAGADSQQIEALKEQLSKVKEYVKGLEEALVQLATAGKIRESLRETPTAE